MIDFSHGNSSKKFENQLLVCQDVCQQIAAGNQDIFGVMVESHLVEGRQDLTLEEPLTYGQSITDACIGWQDTENLLAQLASAVAQRKNQ
jgi:3-deoxy-7-phosphoheptulonate synthase